MLFPWRIAAFDPTEPVMRLHRGVGFRKGDLPPELEQRLDAVLAGGEDPDLSHQLLDHMGRNGQGMGGFWAHGKEGPWLAEGYSGRVVTGPWAESDPAHYQVVVDADWDGNNPDWEWLGDEDYRKLNPGAKVNVRSVRVRAPGVKNWVTFTDGSSERQAIKQVR